MYYRAVKHDGSPVQQYTFMLCSYASLTVIVRGADPTSYGHSIPRPIGLVHRFALLRLHPGARVLGSRYSAGGGAYGVAHAPQELGDGSDHFRVGVLHRLQHVALRLQR
ncbi:hypothetical protein PR002_g31785, partial [Phytophthora rubi]